MNSKDIVEVTDYCFETDFLPPEVFAELTAEDYKRIKGSLGFINWKMGKELRNVKREIEKEYKEMWVSVKKFCGKFTRG